MLQQEFLVEEYRQDFPGIRRHLSLLYLIILFRRFEIFKILPPSPTGLHYRGQLLPSSRQASSNASEGGVNRESSLDDSGVVDDHEEQDVVTGTELVHSSLVEVRQRGEGMFGTHLVSCALSQSPSSKPSVNNGAFHAWQLCRRK